jgi:hypothetical protein
VIVSIVSKFGWYRRAGALVLLALATVAYGCGSSGDRSVGSARPAGEPLKPEQLYKYEGEGGAKRKVDLSRRERMELRNGAAKTAN